MHLACERRWIFSRHFLECANLSPLWSKNSKRGLISALQETTQPAGSAMQASGCALNSQHTDDGRLLALVGRMAGHAVRSGAQLFAGARLAGQDVVGCIDQRLGLFIPAPLLSLRGLIFMEGCEQ